VPGANCAILTVANQYVTQDDQEIDMITHRKRLLSAAVALAIGATANFSINLPVNAVEKAASNAKIELAQNKTAAERREMRRIEREKRRKEREKNRSNRRGPFGGSFS